MLCSASVHHNQRHDGIQFIIPTEAGWHTGSHGAGEILSVLHLSGNRKSDEWLSTSSKVSEKMLHNPPP